MVLAALLGAATIPTLWVRRNEASIVPPEPLPLGGYTARGDHVFEPGGDDLKARVAVLEQGSLRVALVSVEMLTIPGSLSRAVRERLPQDVELVLCATHTHCAPDSQMLNERMTAAIPGIATFKRRWLEWYAQEIALAVRGALVAKPSPFALDLRISEPTHEGAWLNRPRRKLGRPDPAFSTLGGMATLYSAHPTLLGDDERRLRGDWPGELARQTGLLPLVGAIGDRSPTPVPDGPEGFARRLLAAPAKRIAANPEPVMRLAREPIALAPATPSQSFMESNKVPEPLAKLLVGRFAEPEAEVTVLSLDGVALIFVPGEPTSGIATLVASRAAQASLFPLIVGLATNWIGYILTPEDYDEGGYEGSLAFHGRETGLRVVEAASRALDRIRASRSGSEAASRTPRAHRSTGSSSRPLWSVARSGSAVRGSVRPSEALWR